MENPLWCGDEFVVANDSPYYRAVLYGCKNHLKLPLATELPYETASTLFGRLSGITVSSERMHTLIQQVAEGLSVLEVAPSREEIERRVAQVAAGRFRRPVLILGIDGAYVPSRPESARGRRPGQARPRARRARWQHEWREAKGVRFSLLDGERIVHVL